MIMAIAMFSWTILAMVELNGETSGRGAEETTAGGSILKRRAVFAPCETIMDEYGKPRWMYRC